MTKTETGLLPFPSGDDDSIIAAALTSSSAIDGADTQGGGQTFSDNGMDVGASKALLWSSPTGFERLGAEGTMRCEIDKGWVIQDTDLAADNYLMAHDGGAAAAGWNMLRETATDGIYPRPIPVFSDADEIFISSAGKGSQIELAVTWNMGSVYTFIDGLPVQQLQNRFGLKNDRYTNIYLGGDRTNAAKGPDGYRIKNFEVLARQQQFPPHAEYASTLFLGDSLTVLGNLPVDMHTPRSATSNKKLWFSPGFGFANDVDDTGAAGSYADAGYQCTYFRKLFKAGVFPGACYNRAGGGGIISKTQTRADNFFDVDHLKADIVMMIVGTNDLQSSLQSTAQLDALETAYRGILTTLYNKGVKRVVIGTVPTLATHASYESFMEANVANWNVRIKAMKDWSVAQGHGNNFLAVADLFTALGGQDNSYGYFVAGDIHPHEEGNVVQGNLMADKLLGIIGT